MLNSDRTFKIWSYSVSHGHLLLRSPKSNEIKKNIDIIFFGTKFVCLPTMLRGLVVTLKDVAPVSSAGGTDYKEYALFSEGKMYSVVAAGCKLYENDLDIFDVGFGNEGMEAS